MGLGKTMEVVGLILANPAPKKLQPAFHAESGKIRSRATVVFCPNHLAAQWVEEVKKNTSPELKTILLSTIGKNQLKSFLSFLLSFFSLLFRHGVLRCVSEPL
jgi:SNF2 family DNA or RNA helicase